MLFQQIYLFIFYMFCCCLSDNDASATAVRRCFVIAKTFTSILAQQRTFISNKLLFIYYYKCWNGEVEFTLVSNTNVRVYMMHCARRYFYFFCSFIFSVDTVS